jgi:hypothetical protein
MRPDHALRHDTNDRSELRRTGSAAIIPPTPSLDTGVSPPLPALSCPPFLTAPHDDDLHSGDIRRDRALSFVGRGTWASLVAPADRRTDHLHGNHDQRQLFLRRRFPDVRLCPQAWSDLVPSHGQLVRTHRTD